jgi:hypothetical protein
MAALRIILHEIHNQWLPLHYRLQGVGEDPTENTYTYNISRVGTNIINAEYCVIYCARKLDFSGMADNEVKNVKGVGTTIKITNQKDHTTSISMSANALQCMAWGQHLLANCSFRNINSSKRKLPQYILVSDLTQLKENILFHVLWHSNELFYPTPLLSKHYLDITYSLFPDND